MNPTLKRALHGPSLQRVVGGERHQNPYRRLWRRRNQVLRSFYASGQSYSVPSYIALRGGLKRSYAKCNLIQNGLFKSSYVFKSVMKEIRKTSKDTSQHHPSISSADLKPIKESPALSTATAIGFFRKVWFDVQTPCTKRKGGKSRELKGNLLSWEKMRTGMRM